MAALASARSDADFDFWKIPSAPRFVYIGIGGPGSGGLRTFFCWTSARRSGLILYKTTARMRCVFWRIVASSASRSTLKIG